MDPNPPSTPPQDKPDEASSEQPISSENTPEESVITPVEQEPPPEPAPNKVDESVAKEPSKESESSIDSQPKTEAPVVDEIPDPQPTPAPTSPPVPQPKPRNEVTQSRSSSPELGSGTEPAPAQKPKSPEARKAIDVSTMTLDELRAAQRLYTKRMQKDFSAKGVAKRQKTMQLNLREIVDFLSIQNGSPLPRIAKHTNITPGTTSKYLRQLIASGKVRAEGWGKTRRYYLK